MANIVLRVAEASDHDQVLEFIRIHYYKEEPITISHPEPGHTKDDEAFCMSWMPYGTVLVAVDTLNNKLVGALISGPIEVGDADQMIEDAKTAETKKWKDIMLLLAYLENKADVCKRFNVAKALHIHVLGVDASYRGQKIGQRLFQFCFDIAKLKNYPIVSTDCTSIFSIKIAERLGMEHLITTTYDEYNKQLGEDLYKPTPDNAEIKTFFKKIMHN